MIDFYLRRIGKVLQIKQVIFLENEVQKDQGILGGKSGMSKVGRLKDYLICVG